MAGEDLRHPARGGERRKIGRIEARIEFGEIDDADARLFGKAAGGAEEIVDRKAAGPGAGRAGKLGAVDHVDVEIDIERLDMAQSLERVVDRRLDPLGKDEIDVEDANAGGERVLVHPARVGEGGKADLAQGSGKGAAGIDAALAAIRAEMGRS